jgi:hypothetical protein
MSTNLRLEEQDISDAELIRFGTLKCQLGHDRSEARSSKAPLLMCGCFNSDRNFT